MKNDSESLRIQKRLTLARSFTQKWHDNIIRWRNLYDFNHYKEKPLAGETQFCDPTFTNTVDLAVGIFQSNEMEWQASGWNPSLVGQHASSDIEKYLTAVLDTNSDRNEYDIIYETYLHFVRDGGGVLYTVWEPNLAKELLASHEIVEDTEVKSVPSYDGIPIVVEVIDPLEIDLLPGGPNRWLMVSRTTKMTLYDIKLRLGELPSEFVGLDEMELLSSTADFTDYWELVIDAKTGKKIVQNAQLVNNTLMTDVAVMKGYTDLPFDIGFYKPTIRDDSSKWSGIIAPLEPTVSLVERSINRRQRMIDFFSSLPLIAMTKAGSSPIALDPGVGKVLPLTEGESLQFPQWPGAAPDVNQQLTFLMSRVQQSGFSEIMYGGGADTESGYALSQLADQGRIRLEQPITHLQSMWGRWARKVLGLSAGFGTGKEIHVYGRVRGATYEEYLKADRLVGYAVRCNIKADFPNERVRKHSMAVQARGVLSDTTLMEKYYDIQQPDEELEKRLAEQAASNPIMLQYNILKELQRMAVEEKDEAAGIAYNLAKDQVMASLLGQQQAQQQAAPGSAPGGLTGTQSQTGQVPTQATSPGKAVANVMAGGGA